MVDILIPVYFLSSTIISQFLFVGNSLQGTYWINITLLQRDTSLELKKSDNHKKKCSIDMLVLIWHIFFWCCYKWEMVD